VEARRKEIRIPSDEREIEKVADVFVEQLAAWGVRFVYGIPGGSILAFAEAIEHSDKVDLILVRHESTAAFMASAYGKLTGKLGVCFAITGAGSTNLITGMADATYDQSPVLAITGQVRQEAVGTNAFQEIDQYGVFSAVTVYNEMLQSPEQLREVLVRAMRQALLRRGVAHISIPRDLQSEGYIGAPKQIDDLVPGPGPAPADGIARAAEQIRAAGRPVILAGKAAWEARDEVSELSRVLHAPIATTPPAKGLVDEHGEHSLGVLGRLGLTCSTDVFREADIALLVGADIVEQRLVPKVPTIQINPNPLDFAEDLPISTALEGDIALTVRELIGYLPDIGATDWEKRAAEVRAECISALDPEVRSYLGRVHPRAVAEALSDVVAADAVIGVDIGDVTYWYMQYFKATRQRTLISSHLASMGFALPAALAAQLEYPDRQCIAICGDGGFAMSMADFTTAVKYDLPITVVVFNNNAYLRVTGEALEAGLPARVHSLVNPDFAEYATGCGGLGIRVEEVDDLHDGLSEALSSDRPALVEILTDPAVIAVPTLHS